MDILIENDPFQNGVFEEQSIDGTGNNQSNPDYGAADSPLLDIAPLGYSDGFSTPAGQNRPNPRTISNTISQQDEDIPDPRGLTNFIWAWGQFLDHDLDLTPEGQEPIDIQVPTGDPWLDPQGTGNVTIPMNDSEFIDATGTDATNPRQLPNVITSWIDGSNVYGSDEERTNFLRSFQGGRLKISEGNLLPFNDGTIENDNPTQQDPTDLFVAGDVRANENSVLTSLHTLFMREHNRIADALTAAHPDWSDEQIFQRARQINVALMQDITYNEYLPALLGDNALPDYTDYDPSINPNISRTFSSAAFRLGHTQLSSEILRLDINGEVISEGNLTLSEVFFPGGAVLEEAGIDPILRGISSSVSQQVDNQLIDDVRNLLFGFGPNASARDLAAINIQRGRHNGLADYNTIRESFGLARVTSFAEITSDLEKQATLESLYGDVDNIDFFVGMLAEDLLPGASVGESVAAVLTNQFQRLRDGDRFYYENIFTSDEIAEIRSTRLSDIIRRNTDTTIIQDNVFSLINDGTAGNDILNGGLGDDTLNGFAGNDIINGFAGNDHINGGSGNDQMNGGTGDDTYVVDSTGDVVTEDANAGTDTVESSINYVLGDNLENLTLTGTDNIFSLGNALNNELIGNTANNTLFGLVGDDRIDGGAGDDSMFGGVGDDTYVVDSTGDLVSEATNEGTDTVESSITYTLGANLENLTLIGTDVINGFGNSLDNNIIGNTGNNRLNGRAGNDNIDGGEGNDRIFAGRGNDNLNGSDGNDRIFGGRGNDSLNGGNGNDRLIGVNSRSSSPGLGELDVLTGGAGADAFILGDEVEVFYAESTDLLTGTDGYTLITDFTPGEDTIQLKGTAADYRLVDLAPTETFTYQGHTYFVSQEETSWTAAQAQAEALGGNLVTINDASENDWLVGNFGDRLRWIGLSDKLSEGDFQWVNGETSTYRNWAPGEPNNTPFIAEGEDYVELYSNGQWNDVPYYFVNGSGDNQMLVRAGIVEIASTSPGDLQGTAIYRNSPGFESYDLIGIIQGETISSFGSDFIFV